MMDRVVLTVDGTDYTDWTEVSIRRSLEDASAVFSLSVAERTANLAPATIIRPGSACVVSVDDGSLALPAVTGYVDDVEISTDATSHETTVTGRSKTADAIDCSVDIPYTAANVTLYQLARALAAPYGVEATESPTGCSGAPFETWKMEPGESVFECLERAARLRLCLLTDDAEGRLVIRQIDENAQPVAELTMPGNVESARLRVSAANLYTDYEVIGQADGRNKDTYTPEIATVQATATDGTLTRYRLLRVIAEGQCRPRYTRGADDEGGAIERARWEAATRAGRASLYTCTVGSWRIAEGGDLWAPGMLVAVRDTYQGVDGDLLLVDVELTYGADGTRANLSLSPLAGYLPESPDEGETRKAKKKKAAKAQAGIVEWFPGGVQ